MGQLRELFKKRAVLIYATSIIPLNALIETNQEGNPFVCWIDMLFD
jgi:hypothetical protein